MERGTVSLNQIPVNERREAHSIIPLYPNVTLSWYKWDSRAKPSTVFRQKMSYFNKVVINVFAIQNSCCGKLLSK